MKHQEILEKIKTKVEVPESKEDLGILNATVKKEDLKAVITFLKDELGFDHLPFLSAIDWIENNIIEAVYRLYSYATNDSVVVRVKLDRANPEVDTITDIFKTADWHEREAAEMYGMKFTGHPDLSKLLLPEDIDSPLRKDFKHEDFKPLA